MAARLNIAGARPWAAARAYLVEQRSLRQIAQIQTMTILARKMRAKPRGPALNHEHAHAHACSLFIVPLHALPRLQH